MRIQEKHAAFTDQISAFHFGKFFKPLKKCLQVLEKIS